MLRKFLILFTCAVSVLIVVVLYDRFYEPQPVGTIIERAEQLSEMAPAPPVEEKIVPECVRMLNDKNAKITSLTCGDMGVKAWNGGHRFRLSGSIAYEKPNLFRFEIDSILGNEVDIGSNSELFWYWSRRDKSPGLKWAKHEDYEKTGLKTPFNPFLMKSSLGVEVFDISDAKVVDGPKEVMLIYPRRNCSGQPILYSVFVDKEKARVGGFVVTSVDGKTLASCEIQEHKGELPSKILYTWHEESRVMLLTLNDAKVNVPINPSKWRIPDLKPKFNMADR